MTRRSTSAPQFRHVPEHVARNPIAQAIARRNLTLAARDFQISLYLLAEGDDVTADVIAASKLLAVAMAILAARQHDSSTEARIIAGGMSCLAQCSQRHFRWHPRDAVAIDMALASAVTVYRGATPLETQRAYQRITAAELEAPTNGTHHTQDHP